MRLNVSEKKQFTYKITDDAR